MVANLNGNTAARLLCVLLSCLWACATGSAVADTAALPVSPSLQHEFEQLMYCYATAADLAGAGEGEASVQQGRSCFTDDAVLVVEFPPAWAYLNVTVTGGPQAFTQAAIQFYQAFGFTRTQHMVGNVVVQRTGATTAVMRSYISAVHVYPDESVLATTAMTLDGVRFINGHWKIEHKVETLTSLTQAPAWMGAPPPP
jgi:hypothetical protein